MHIYIYIHSIYTYMYADTYSMHAMIHICIYMPCCGPIEVLAVGCKQRPRQAWVPLRPTASRRSSRGARLLQQLGAKGSARILEPIPTMSHTLRPAGPINGFMVKTSIYMYMHAYTILGLR